MTERKQIMVMVGKRLTCHWAVIGDLGASHFVFDVVADPAYPEDLRRLHAFWPLCPMGIEYHWRKPPHHYKDIGPHHEDCWLIGGPCWHDGSSLYASEHLMPGFIAHGHEWLWQELESLYHEMLSEDAA